MKCAKCGAEIKEGCIYCSVCGNAVQIVPDYSVLEDDYLRSLLKEEESAGTLQNGGYPDRCNRKAAVYHGRLHQRRGGCHRCGNSPR